MRGKASPRLKIEPLRGITPACAGKSRGTPFRRTSGRDHPRVCGEKWRIHGWGGPIWGSPPRVRGKDTNDANTGATVGITPAYAGKSCRSPQGAGRAWDHPRVCGEKMMATAEAKAMEGSPPRMRGKVVADCGPKNTARITPAYAGKRVVLLCLL